MYNIGSSLLETLWRGGRAVECGGLETVVRVILVPWFESHLLRHSGFRINALELI